MQLNRAQFLGGFDVLESRVDRFEYTPHRHSEGLILCCTEILLLIDQPDMPDFPMFNTAKLHCEAAIELALAD